MCSVIISYAHIRKQCNRDKLWKVHVYMTLEFLAFLVEIQWFKIIHKCMHTYSISNTMYRMNTKSKHDIVINDFT